MTQPVPHRLLMLGEPRLVDRVASQLASAAPQLKVCRELPQAVALARQFVPSVLVWVGDASSRAGREMMAALTMEPATSAMPLVVVTPKIEPWAAITCFTGGVAALIDVDAPPTTIVSHIQGHIGEGPADRRLRIAVDASGPATLRRIGRYMQAWRVSAEVRIAGAPNGPAAVRWIDGVFGGAIYGELNGPEAATALLGTEGGGSWRFQTDGSPTGEAAFPPSPSMEGEAADTEQPSDGIEAESTDTFEVSVLDEDTGDWGEESLDMFIDVATDPYVPTKLPSMVEDAGLPGAKVLVVDDEPDILALYEKTGENRGWTVKTALNGKQGYELALDWRPDLIVSDIMMPETDGWGFLGLVRGDFRVRETPFVLLSCHADFLSKLRALDAGADDYLEKGLRPSQVIERLEAVVTPRRKLAAAAAPGKPFGGQLVNTGAQHILRTLQRKKVSGRLRVEHRGGIIEVSHENGKITDARTASGDLEEYGFFALQSLLALDDGHFSFTPDPPLSSDFTRPFDEIADDLCAELNERREAINQEMFAHNDPLVCERPRLRDFYLASCPDLVRPIATSLFGGKPPREVLATGGSSPVLVEAVVKDILRKGVAKFAA